MEMELSRPRPPQHYLSYGWWRSEVSREYLYRDMQVDHSNGGPACKHAAGLQELSAHPEAVNKQEERAAGGWEG